MCVCQWMAWVKFPIANYTHAGRKVSRIVLSISASDLSPIALEVLFTMKGLLILYVIYCSFG